MISIPRSGPGRPRCCSHPMRVGGCVSCIVDWLTVPTQNWDVLSTQSLPCVFRFTDTQGKDTALGFVVV